MCQDLMYVNLPTVTIPIGIPCKPNNIDIGIREWNQGMIMLHIPIIRIAQPMSKSW